MKDLNFNKKRRFAAVFLFMIIAALVLSLASCGKREMAGIEVKGYVESKSYNSETGLTSLEFNVSATNENSTRAVRSYSFKIVFRDSNGVILETKIFSGNEGLRPNATETVSYTFSESGGNAVGGKVSTVEVYPVQMSISNEAVQSPDGGAPTPKWGFWAWFWSIVSGILIIIFLLGAFGSNWDGEAVLGGIIICVIPAIIILVVYFGFVYGSGV